MESDFSRTLSGGRADFPAVLEALEEHLADQGTPPAAVASVMIALDEVVTNILDYGGEGARAPLVSIAARTDGTSVQVQVEDDGSAFNPMEKAAPDTSLSVEERAVGGLGIHLVRKLMDDVAYDRADGRNRLRFSKGFASQSSTT